MKNALIQSLEEWRDSLSAFSSIAPFCASALRLIECSISEINQITNELEEKERENARLRNRITTKALADALVQAYVIPPSAIEDPDGYDGYATLDAIAKCASILSNAASEESPGA